MRNGPESEFEAIRYESLQAILSRAAGVELRRMRRVFRQGAVHPMASGTREAGHLLLR